MLLASKPVRRVCIKFCQSETLEIIETAYFVDEATDPDPVDPQLLEILKRYLNIVKKIPIG